MLVANGGGSASTEHRLERLPTCIRLINSFSGCILRNDRDIMLACTSHGGSPTVSGESRMATLNWFYATIFTLILCLIAIAVPFLLGLLSTAN